MLLDCNSNFTVSVTVSKLFKIWLPIRRLQLCFPYLAQITRYSLSKCALPWPWPLELVKFKCKYANRKPRHDLLSDGNGNFYSICHHYQDIHSWNLHDPDLDLLNQTRSPVSMLFERPHMTSHSMATATCAYICHCLSDNQICTFEMMPILIFEIKIEGQGREERRRLLHFRAKLDRVRFGGNKWQFYLKLFICGPPMSCTVAHLLALAC